MLIPFDSHSSAAGMPPRRRCARGWLVPPGLDLSGSIALLAPGGMEVLQAEHGVVVLAREECEACLLYERDLLARLQRGELPDVVVRKVLLDPRGAEAFRRSQPQPEPLAPLPYTLLFLNGEQVDGFATASGAYLLERMEAALVVEPW